MSEISYIDLAKQMEKIGVQTIVFTDISKDGTLAGPNIEQLSYYKKRFYSTDCFWRNCIYTRCEKLNDMNVYGVIIGKALYEKTIDLEEVLEVTKLC